MKLRTNNIGSLDRIIRFTLSIVVGGVGLYSLNPSIILAIGLLTIAVIL